MVEEAHLGIVVGLVHGHAAKFGRNWFPADLREPFAQTIVQMNHSDVLFFLHHHDLTDALTLHPGCCFAGESVGFHGLRGGGRQISSRQSLDTSLGKGPPKVAWGKIFSQSRCT